MVLGPDGEPDPARPDRGSGALDTLTHADADAAGVEVVDGGLEVVERALCGVQAYVAPLLPLAEHLARRARGRDVSFTRAAERAMRDFSWPGNVDQLGATVRGAALRTDTIDVRHLPAEVFSGSGGHRLTRIETVEVEEIVRALTRPGATVRDAAEELGMSRATIYRKLAQYDLRIPGRGERRSG